MVTPVFAVEGLLIQDDEYKKNTSRKELKIITIKHVYDNLKRQI